MARVLEDAVALAVPDDVRPPLPAGSGVADQNAPGLLVADEDASPGGSQTGSLLHGVSRLSWLLTDQV